MTPCPASGNTRRPSRPTSGTTTPSGKSSRFADEQLDLRPMDLEEQFLMGFRLGARLMIEVLDQPET